MRSITRLILAGLVACGWGLVAHAARAAGEKTETPIGRTVQPFELQDFHGRTYRLRDFDDRRVVVLAVLGIECPLVKLYTPRLIGLANEFADQGVAVLAINANRQDSITEMAHFARVYKVNFPLLKDAGNHVVDQIGAIRTPEFFVLDENRVIRYWGAMDDQYGFQKGVGYQKPKPERHNLAEAIREILAGKPVSVPVTRAPGCLIGRVRKPKQGGTVTYSNQIARLFQKRCVECHREGEIAPFALTDYDEVVGWSEMIAEVVRENRMPPWHADRRYGHWKNDCRPTAEEKALLEAWLAAGSPEGDPANLPEPRKFVEGWRLPKEPDLVVSMRDKPFTVPADGTIEYQYFTVDPGFKQDVWVKAAECRPGNRTVVHHIIVYMIPHDAHVEGNLPEGVPGHELLAGTAPGNPPTILPEGMAVRVPAGTKFVFEMHYTAVGVQAQDLSSIGLVFADPEKVRYEAQTGLAINPYFEIPAGAHDHEVTSKKTFRKDGLLISLMPHMHLRGAAFRYELHYQDGRREVLLDIPHYDFNWQNTYYLAEPKFVPKGTRLYCVARFDNSEDNLANPDPTQPVRWGLQTWEEMMIGWFVWAPVPKSYRVQTAAAHVTAP